MEVQFPHDKLIKSRLWKDFRSNFTLTSKYLEDVKNGFYPLFGCRWDAYQGEEEEGTCVACAGVSGFPLVSGVSSCMSNGSSSIRNDPLAPVGICSSCASTAASACVSAIPDDQKVMRCEDVSKGCISCNVDEFHQGFADCLSSHLSKIDSGRLTKAVDDDLRNDDASTTADEVTGLISNLKVDDDNNFPSKSASLSKTTRPLKMGQSELKWSEKPFVISISNEEGGQNEPTGFASLLKEYLNRYEDETVIMEVQFPHDKLIKSRLWKDFRSNFTLTSKYLEDVKMASSSKGNSMKCIKPNKPKKIKDVKSKRPPGPYALFVQSRKSLYRGKISEFAKTCASEWRKLSQVERDKFKQNQSN
ncbi:unnamed protein product [Heterobilharzia americana]|nr:unnamed protein product [Heterobilharzia americana]